MDKIWEIFVRENPRTKTIPLILPLVVYHDKTTWNAPTCLADLFGLAPETRRDLDDYVPNLHFILDDLSAQNDENIRARPMDPAALMVLWALKWARHNRPDLLPSLAEWMDTFRASLCSQRRKAILALVIEYTLQHNEIEPDLLEQFLYEQAGESAKEFS